MNKFNLLQKGCCMLFLYLFVITDAMGSVTNAMESDVLILNENIQSWTAFSAYKDATQEVTINNETKFIELSQVIVRSSSLPSGFEEQGPCTDGYVQMSKDKESKIQFPTIAGGVSKIELHIITTVAAARTVDVKVAETSVTETLSGLSKTGAVYTVDVGNSGNTTISIENVTGGVIYITDIKIYQKKESNYEISSDATLSSLSYKIGNETFSVEGFAANKMQYDIVLPAGTTSLPVVTGICNHKDASVKYTQISEMPGTAIVQVNASDGISTNEYKINFTKALEQKPVASLPLAAVASSEEPLHSQTGFTASYLGTPMTDGSAKFEGSKALTDNKPTLLLQFDSEGNQLSFDLKGNNAGSPSGFEGVVFVVEESADGNTFTQIASLTSEITTSKQTFGDYKLKADSRFVRWIYQDAVKGNLALNTIVISETATAVSAVNQLPVQVYAKDGFIVVETSVESIAEIYNIVGQKILTKQLEAGINTMYAGENQIVIVKIGEFVSKVML